MKIYYVYLLKCADQRLYTGITSRLDERVFEHQAGNDPKAYTFNRRPVELVFSTDFSEVNDAIAFEKQIKGWRREKKLALIEGRIDALPELSANYSNKTTKSTVSTSTGSVRHS